MEFKIEELRLKNIIKLKNGLLKEVVLISDDKINVGDIYGDERLLHLKVKVFPVELTKEILRDNLGFEISDMGDFWQCQKEDFVLIQIKLSIGSMPYMFVLKSSIKESVNFYYVHHLQNTYLDLKGELLLWKS